MYEPKIHYDPFKNRSYDPYDEDCSERGYCGTFLSEEFDNSTNNKSFVTCKKCIKLFAKSDKEMKSHLDNQLEDMQAFVSFCGKDKGCKID